MTEFKATLRQELLIKMLEELLKERNIDDNKWMEHSIEFKKDGKYIYTSNEVLAYLPSKESK